MMYLHELFLIRPDLRHEETIIQAANCLERLTNVINEVFDKIDRRVVKNCERIKSLNSRSSAVRKKIDSLTGINKATTIFSPVRFPNVLSINKSHSIEKVETGKYVEKSDIHFIDEIKFEAAPRRSMSDKSKFYYVDSYNRTYNCSQSFPYYTETVNSLLLFNTHKNIYSKHQISSDSSRYKKKIIDEPVSSDMVRIEASPLPILNRNMSTRKVKEDLFYTPSFLNAPELDLPQYLPDLPGIANDIEFNIDDFVDMPVPKPVTTINQTIDIPEIVHEIHEDPNKEVEIIEKPKHEDETDLPTMLPPITLIIPPPPPPMPVTPKTTVPAQVNQADDRSALLNSIRSGKTLRKVDRSENKKEVIVDDLNPHSSLMASIRQAGGSEKAKLRAVTLGAEKPLNATSSGSGSGDLMADLHKKLALRRKGISGSKKDDPKIASVTSSGNIQGFGLMESISSMIPVPLYNTKESNDDDSDWD